MSAEAATKKTSVEFGLTCTRGSVEDLRMVLLAFGGAMMVKFACSSRIGKPGGIDRVVIRI